MVRRDVDSIFVYHLITLTCFVIFSLFLYYPIFPRLHRRPPFLEEEGALELLCVFAMLDILGVLLSVVLRKSLSVCGIFFVHIAIIVASYVATCGNPFAISITSALVGILLIVFHWRCLPRDLPPLSTYSILLSGAVPLGFIPFLTYSAPFYFCLPPGSPAPPPRITPPPELLQFPLTGFRNLCLLLLIFLNFLILLPLPIYVLLLMLVLLAGDGYSSAVKGEPVRFTQLLEMHNAVLLMGCSWLFTMFLGCYSPSLALLISLLLILLGTSALLLPTNPITRAYRLLLIAETLSLVVALSFWYYLPFSTILLYAFLLLIYRRRRSSPLRFVALRNPRCPRVLLTALYLGFYAYSFYAMLPYHPRFSYVDYNIFAYCPYLLPAPLLAATAFRVLRFLHHRTRQQRALST